MVTFEGETTLRGDNQADGVTGRGQIEPRLQLAPIAANRNVSFL